MRHSTPLPGDSAPDLKLPVLEGADLDLAGTTPEAFSVIFFYRGLHCPICRKQLEELARKRVEFIKAGHNVHVVSMDSRERAERQKAEWTIADLPIAYDLSEEGARAWGLFVSEKKKDAEPDRFAEPGIAVIDHDGRIYALYLQSVPFARPSLDDILKGLEFVQKNRYPVRGELAA